MDEPPRKKVRLIAESRQSQTFSAADADLVFESSDGVIFKLHRANLTAHSHAFPGEHVKDDGEVVRLQEDAEVLELLLLHVYPDPAPSLDGESFGIISRLAEAAEKYQIVSAMEICRLHMKIHHKTNPTDVLRYACKHGYHSLADSCAPLTLDCNPSDMLSALGLVDYARWSLYRESWIQVRSYLHTCCITRANVNSRTPRHIERHTEACRSRVDIAWNEFARDANNTSIKPLLTKMGHVEELLQPIFASAVSCSSCRKWWDSVKADINRIVGEMPAFSDVSLSTA
ncbi:hypothetical protein PENSPDRAFT_657341 [Peniophora sp. CONT]|nr:hypothetical protein PENSPDRAFT_657341 [Peniophora sp. CONT]